MVNCTSRPVGNPVDVVLGWSAIIWAIQQMGPAITFFQPSNDTLDTDNHGNRVFEVGITGCTGG